MYLIFSWHPSGMFLYGLRTIVWILTKEERYLLNYLYRIYASVKIRKWMNGLVYLCILFTIKSLKDLLHDTAFLFSFRGKSASIGASSVTVGVFTGCSKRFSEVHVPLQMILFILFWNVKMNYYSTTSNYNWSKKEKL
jgi:hypothetical protein